MAKYREGYKQLGFKLHNNLAKQFDEEIALWNKETGMNVSKTDMLQLLVLRFCIGREEARQQAKEAKAEASEKTDNNKIN